MSLPFSVKAGLLSASIVLVQSLALNAQQVIDFDTENAVTILSSGSLDITNVAYSGCSEQFMLLTGVGPIGIDCGLLMSSGNASNWLCSDNYALTNCTSTAPISDTLLTIANSVPGLIGQSFSVNSVNDIAFIEFDVVAQGDFIGFDFIFYSDEYTNYINSQYNDVFALLASGPGIAGTNGEPAVNLAVVPNSDPALPITISSVHPNLNSIYYVDEFPPQFCANGGTDRLYAVLETVPDSTYHFQFGIADGSDTALNSYVLVSGLVSGEMVGCGDPLACNYCGSAINYADSVCTYTEYEILDTLDVGTVGISCPSFSLGIEVEEAVDGTFNSLQGEIIWTEYPGDDAPEASLVNGSLSSNVLNLSIDIPAGGNGGYIGMIQLPGANFCSGFSIPLVLDISENGSTPLEIIPAWENNLFNGDSTCSTYGSVSGEFVSPDPNLCTWFSQYDGTLTIDWTEYPASSDLEFSWVDAFVCDAGFISVEYSGGSPGSYEGTFLLTDFSLTECNSISIPFSFTITNEDLPPAIADIEWDNGLFDGDTTCSTYGYVDGWFNDPSNFTGCDEFYFEYGLSVQWDNLPDGSDFQFNYANAWICGDAGISLEYSGGTPGYYQGQFVIQPQGYCQSILVPFSFTITDEDLPPAIADIEWNNGLFDGDTTCSTYGYFDGYFNDIAGFTGCEWLYFEGSNEYGLSVQWDSLPDNGNFQFNWAQASLCGDGNIYGDFSGGTPGYYQGQFVIQPQGYCQSILVPFSFTITDEDLPPAIADIEWNNGLFDGDTTCSTYGYVDGWFNDPSNFTGCDEFYFEYGLSVQWDNLPDGSDFQFNYANAWICGDAGISLEYSGGTPGYYQGQFVIQPQGYCQSILVPFSFTITDEDLPPAIADIEWNNGLFDGDTTCSTYGYFDGYFNDIAGFTGCEWLYFEGSNEYGLSVQWDSLPDNGNFQFNWAQASLCGDGNIYGDFSGGTPGYYQGQFVIQPQGYCQSILVPFSFTITDEDLPPAIADIEWNNGLFDGDTTCSTYGYFDGYFNDIAGFTDCEWFYFDGYNEYGLSVQWDSLPDNGNFQFNWVEASLCGGGNIYGDFSGGTPGYYQGQFVIQPQGYCQSILVPFSFTITDEDLPPAIADIEWNNGLFDGDTTCSTYGYFDGYFNDIAGFTECEWLYFEGSNEYGLSVQWDSLPDNGNFQFNWVEASLCGDGNIYGDFSGGTPGYYQGQFVIQPQGYCQSILVPFSFTITDEDLPPAIADIEWNNGLFDGDTTCSTYGYFDGYFNDIAGFTECEWLYFEGSNEYGLSVQWDSLPDNGNFQFNWVEASLCGDGNIYGDFSGGTPGYYQGQFVIQPQGYCQSILVPFAFTISEPDPTPVIAEVDWDDQLFMDGTTCETSGYHSGNFDNPSDYSGCNEFYSDNWGTYGMWVEWDSMPEGSSMEFTFLYSVICEDWNEIGIAYSGASEGTYSGNFVIQPEGSCQLIHIPFNFTVSEAPLEVVTPWSAPLNGEAICTGWGTSVTEFEMPTNVACGEFNWVDSEFSPLDIVWTSQALPPTIVSAGVDHCGTSSAHLTFTDAQPGIHTGYLRLATNGLCEIVHIPFTIEVVEEDPTSLSLAPEWNSGFTGTECLFEGNGQASFAVPDVAYCSALPYTLEGGVSLGMDIIWTEMPAGSLMHITSAQAEICGGEGTLLVEYAGGTGGQYAGEFILSPNDTCLEFRVPFAFDLLNPTAVLAMNTEGMTPNDDGHFAVCTPMTLHFNGNASYSEDGQGAIAHWIWHTANGQTDTLGAAAPFDWTVSEAGVETVRLSVVDEAGCSSPLTDAIVLLGSPSPIMELDWSETVCAGSPGFAEVLTLDPGGWQNGEVTAEYDQPIYNTDYGQFDFTLEIDQYAENAVVSECIDLAVNLTIEHSYLGDLDILVTCPNGTTVPLLSFPNGGGSTFLGEPVDDGSNTPGTGYDYTWSTTPDNLANVNSSSNWTTIYYTDNAGNLVTANVVNAGSYAPDGNLCDFTGCPLNGTWTMTLIDNLNIDDGHVFGWGMDFGAEPLGEPLVTIQPSIGVGADSAAWNGVGLLEQDYVTWHAGFVVDEPGLHEFTFTTLNNFGCTHDTTIQVTAIAPPEMNISAGEDLLWCGEPLTLSATIGYESPSPCSNSEENVSYCYSNNEYTTWTYCPDDAGDGTMMSLVFEAGEIEGFFDHLYIFDGLDESAPLIMDLSGSWNAFTVTATNDFGCLYVALTSDGSVSCSSGAYSAPIEWCSSCGGSACAYNWNWEPADWLSASDLASPQLEGLSETTTFIATVEPVSLEYCSVTDTVTVQIPDYEWECDGGYPCFDGTTWDDGVGQCVHTDPCPWDLTGDGQVTTSDLLSFLGSFATYCETDETEAPEESSYCGLGTTWSAEDGGCVPDEACPADFTSDGIVGLADLLLLLPQMGNSCE